MVCALTFVTCFKSDVSVVIFASCTAVVRGRGINTPRHADSKARSAVGFGERSTAVHPLCMHLYCITL